MHFFKFNFSFTQTLRGSALGVYNWGIYIGYSMAYAFGNFITQADIDGKGWRWVFWIAAMPGFVLGILMLFTLKEPARSERGDIHKQVCHLDNCPFKNILAV